MLTEVLALLLTFFILICILKWFRSSRGLPPGPPCYPLVGSLPSIVGSFTVIHKALTNMAKRYGDVFSIYLPGRPVVIINSFGSAREALIAQKDTFSGRPSLFTTNFLTYGGKGLAFADFSAKLVFVRKVVHSAMRLYQPHLEGKIMEEALEILKRFQSYGDQPFDPRADLSLAVTNVIYAIMYGNRFDLDNKEFLESVRISDKASQMLGPINILNFFPWLIHFPIPQTKMLYKVMENRAQLRDARYFQAKETFQENKIRHLVDALLQAKLDEESDGASSHDDIAFDDIELVVTTSNIFGAGSETTASILKWLIAYMMNFPAIQEKIYAEIKEIFGYDGKVELTKRKNCHYLEATLTETLRYASVVPLVVHKTTCDTTFSGYHIPKDTTVLLNIWAINHDEREWANPEEFNPDRFLDSEGHFNGTMKMSYIPFGAGRRVCIGESLAKSELFLMSATLLQKFKFENPPGCSPPDIKDGTRGLIYAPKPYQVIAKER